jgi:hypothetical protein
MLLRLIRACDEANRGIAGDDARAQGVRLAEGDVLARIGEASETEGEEYASTIVAAGLILGDRVRARGERIGQEDDRLLQMADAVAATMYQFAGSLDVREELEPLFEYYGPGEALCRLS